MKKVLIVSILAIAMVFACVGCNFGVAPVHYTRSAEPQTTASSGATSGASATSGSSATATVTPSSNPSAVNPSSVSPTTQPTTPTWKTMDQTVYTPAFVLHNTSNAMDVQINLQNGATSVTSIQLIDKTAQSPNTWNFAYESGVLKVPQDFLTAKGTGKFTLRANTNSGAVDCTLLVATKVITTCQEFQNIGSSLEMPLNGTYVLGNDLDFSTFGNFNPIGNTATKTAGGDIGNAFTGVLFGAGHKIMNLTADADVLSDDEIYTQHDIPMDGWTIDTLRSCFAIFMRNTGTISDICFKDCLVNNTAGTIMGMVTAVNKGTIENVILDGGSVIGGDIWLDFNCFVAGFAGMNGENGVIKNCICAINEIEGNSTHTLVRGFVGKNYSSIENCYAKSISSYTFFDIAMHSEYGEFIEHQGVYTGYEANTSVNAIATSERTGYGFTYLGTYDELQSETNPYGIIVKAKMTDSGMKTEAELIAGTTANIYSNYSTAVWTINGSTMPQLNVLYTKA